MSLAGAVLCTLALLAALDAVVAAEASAATPGGAFLRGSGGAAADPPRDGGAEGRHIPQWCHHVPDEFRSDACRGSGRGCTCRPWCRHAPAAHREMIPDCCGCIDAELPAPDGNAPEWCGYVPEAEREDACTGCACREWCEDTPVGSWQWNPECCGCDGANATTPAWNGTSSGSARPEWCQFVPAQDRPGVCDGDSDGSGCRCRDWCSSTPVVSRAWNSECCGCEDVARPSDGLPEWCQFVPEDSRGDACSDVEHACQCRDWCRDTPSVSWGWNPECCGCERGSSPRSGGEVGSGAPEWCRFVPREDRDEACHGVGRSCECRGWCDAVPRFTHRWNPECCGCGADGGRPPRAGDGARGDRGVPAWCEYVPEEDQDEACHSGDGETCSCMSWCANTPEFSHRWHPECCGCARSGHDDDDDDDDHHHHHGSHRGGDDEVPAWCRHIPAIFRSRSCRERGGGGGRCGCSRWCADTPEVSRRWHPECCGCDDSGHEAEDGDRATPEGGRPAKALLGKHRDYKEGAGGSDVARQSAAMSILALILAAAPFA